MASAYVSTEFAMPCLPVGPLHSKPNRCWYFPDKIPAREGAQTLAVVCASRKIIPLCANLSMCGVRMSLLPLYERSAFPKSSTKMRMTLGGAVAAAAAS